MTLPELSAHTPPKYASSRLVRLATPIVASLFEIRPPLVAVIPPIFTKDLPFED